MFLINSTNYCAINPDKTEVMWVGAPNASGLGSSLSFGGVTLTMKSELGSLGVYLDPVLTMET